MSKVNFTNFPVEVDLECQLTDSHCGAAVIQLQLAYYGIKVTQDQVVAAAKVKSKLMRYGMRPDQLARGAKKLAPHLNFWFKQATTNKDLETLLHTYRVPVGINWQGLFYNTLEEEQIDNPDGEHGHYSTAIDIDTENDVLVMADSYSENYTIPRYFSYQWFKTRWWDVDHIVNRKTGITDSIYTKRMIFLLAPHDVEYPRLLKLKPAHALVELAKLP